MNADFKAFKYDRSGMDLVEVIPFNGSMAVCCDDDGPVIITKEQAMKFFNLVDAEIKLHPTKG